MPTREEKHQRPEEAPQGARSRPRAIGVSRSPPTGGPKSKASSPARTPIATAVPASVNSVACGSPASTPGPASNGLSYNQLIHGLKSRADRSGPQDPCRPGRPRARSLCPDGRSAPNKRWKPRSSRLPRPSRVTTGRRGRRQANMIRDIAGHQNHRSSSRASSRRRSTAASVDLLVGEGMDLLLAAVAGGADVREILIRRELLQEVPAGLREQAAASSGRPAGAAPRGCEDAGVGRRARHRHLRPGDPGPCQRAGRLGRRHLHLHPARGPPGRHRPQRANWSSSSTAWATRATWAPSSGARWPSAWAESSARRAPPTLTAPRPCAVVWARSSPCRW